MLRRRFSGRGGSTFIGSSTTTTTAATALNFNLPVGATAGMLCVIIHTANAPLRSMPTGFTTIDFTGIGQRCAVAYKVLVAADITAGYVTLPASGGASNTYVFAMGVYSGPASLALASSVGEVSAAGATTTIPGFTMNAECIGLIGAVGEGASGASGTHDFPSPWEDRTQATLDGNIASLHDLVDSGAYSGGAVVVSGLSNVGVTAAILEMRA